MQVPTLLTKKQAFEILETRETFLKYKFIYFVTRSVVKRYTKFFSETSTIIQQVGGRWRLRPLPTCTIMKM